MANEDDNDDAAKGKIAKLIVNESKDLKSYKYKYRTRVHIDDAIADVSSTMLHLLSLVSPKLNSSLSACMVENIVTSMVTNRPTALQIALGVLVRQKSLIEQLYDFGVTSSYDGILRFKASVAHETAKIQNFRGISDCGIELVQTVSDNYDANISSQTGLQSYSLRYNPHSHRVIMTTVAPTK